MIITPHTETGQSPPAPCPLPDLTDPAAAEEFLTKLYGDNAGELSGKVGLWSKGNGTTWFSPTGLRVAAHAACRNAQTVDEYFHVALHDPRKAGGRGKNDSAVAIPGLWAEFDLLGPGHVATNLPTTADEVRRALKEDFPLEPTVLVRSSDYGIHGYWLLEEPWTFEDDDERREAEALLRRFHGTLAAAWQARGWQLDPVSDLARVLRLPGTVNRKEGRPPVTVRLLPGGSGRRYQPDDFDPYLVDDAYLPRPFVEATVGSGEFPPAAIAPIVAGCAWMRQVRDKAASTSQPHWYAALSILGRCEDGQQLAHDWSTPHPKYRQAETDATVARALQHGPRTCASVAGQLAFAGCKSCPSYGHIKSPINLSDLGNNPLDLGGAADDDASSDASDASDETASQDFPPGSDANDANDAVLPSPQKKKGERGRKKGDGPTQATQLVQLAAKAGGEYFHTPTDDVYVTVKVSGHRETWACRGQVFRQWLSRRYYETTHAVAGDQAIRDAINVLAAQALFTGACREVFVRTAKDGAAFYLDLGDATWRVVKITAGRWEVLDAADCPVRFRRPQGLLALPEPSTTGDLEQLRRFVNVGDGEAGDRNWRLIVAWLLAALRPEGPYPALNIQGEQGAAKSFTTRVLRRLIDHNTVPLRSEPKEQRDLMVAAKNNWVLTFDNLSHLPEWLSDALCRLSTGGGYATRLLYSDDQEALFDAQRPVLINGIENVAVRSDLLDRVLSVTLPAIPDDKRREERELWPEFLAAWPTILAGLLDAAAAALEALPTTTLALKPRMADFAVWATAAEKGLGWEDGVFMEAYEDTRVSASSIALEGSPIALPLMELVRAHKGIWEGTAFGLLQELVNRTGGEQVKRPRSWPVDATRLRGQLNRIKPNLRAIGITVEDGARTGTRRPLILTMAKLLSESREKTASLASLASPPDSEGHDASSDAASDAGPSVIDGDCEVSGCIRPGIVSPDGRCHCPEHYLDIVNGREPVPLCVDCRAAGHPAPPPGIKVWPSDGRRLCGECWLAEGAEAAVATAPEMSGVRR